MLNLSLLCGSVLNGLGLGLSGPVVIDGLGVGVDVVGALADRGDGVHDAVLGTQSGGGGVGIDLLSVLAGEDLQAGRAEQQTGGACLPMYKVATMSIRASKIKRIETDWSEDFLTVPEAYYLATSSGHRYFGDGDGFAPGNRLHAIVVDDGDFTEASHPLTVRERFERAIYMLHRHNITAVWSDGRCVVGKMLQ